MWYVYRLLLLRVALHVLSICVSLYFSFVPFTRRLFSFLIGVEESHRVFDDCDSPRLTPLLPLLLVSHLIGITILLLPSMHACSLVHIFACVVLPPLLIHYIVACVSLCRVGLVFPARTYRVVRSRPRMSA
jgi:hypothetical protein